MSKQHIASPEEPRRTAISCVVATATAAVALAAPTVALAEKPTTAPPTTEPSATTATAEAPSATAPYTTTQTVAKDEKTFATKDDAQAYLDNAEKTWAETDKKDTASTYEVKTTGPEKVDSTTTSTTTTVKEDSKEFNSQDEADKWVKGNTSGYQNTGDTTFNVKSGVDKVESGTTEETNDVAHGEKDGFPSKQAAEDWVAGQTEQYKYTADATYRVDSTVTPKEDFSTWGEKDGDATTQEYGPFDSEEEAAAERAAESANDPSSTLHEVTFGEVTSKEVDTKTETVHVTGGTFASKDARDRDLEQKTTEAERDGYTVKNKVKTQSEVAWGGKGDSSTEYHLGANSFAAIKQSTWYVIWTPETVDSDTLEAIKNVIWENDPSNKAYKGCFTGFDKNFSTSEKTSGVYWVTKNDDGSYTMHVSSTDKISHLDYGTLPTYSYSFDKTRQTPILKWYFTKTVQNYMPVVEWSAEYTVSSVTKVPTYKYKAWYKVTKTEKVTRDVWKAGYEVVKTTTFAPPVTPPTTPPTTPPLAPPATPKTPEAPKVAVQKAAVQRQAVVAKATVPRTSDSTNLAGAGILAGLAVAFGAAGIVLRRRARKLD